jgi:MoxR-like ATPase
MSAPIAGSPSEATPRNMTAEALIGAIQRLRSEIAKRIVGQDAVVDEILMAMVAGGHALLVGVPGLAKTLMIKSISDAMRLDFRRILEEGANGARAFRFVRGPVFANIVLADEINRAPPRTQAALLEAMQEHSVTAAGQTMRLPEPFFVLATQNPIEQEGTYPLPEAQLDRFLFDIRVGYPSEAEEISILRATTGRGMGRISAVFDADEALALQRLVREMPCSDVVLHYATQLVRLTRPAEVKAPPIVKQYLRWGAGPRAGQALILGAKASAFLAGRAAVSPSDIQRVALPVLRHRVLLNFAAEAEGVDAESIVQALLAHVPAPSSALPA